MMDESRIYGNDVNIFLVNSIFIILNMNVEPKRVKYS